MKALQDANSALSRSRAPGASAARVAQNQVRTEGCRGRVCAEYIHNTYYSRRGHYYDDDDDAAATYCRNM
jgi:hypothetical protein